MKNLTQVKAAAKKSGARLDSLDCFSHDFHELSLLPSMVAILNFSHCLWLVSPIVSVEMPPFEESMF